KAAARQHRQAAALSALRSLSEGARRAPEELSLGSKRKDVSGPAIRRQRQPLAPWPQIIAVRYPMPWPCAVMMRRLAVRATESPLLLVAALLAVHHRDFSFVRHGHLLCCNSKVRAAVSLYPIFTPCRIGPDTATKVFCIKWLIPFVSKQHPLENAHAIRALRGVACAPPPHMGFPYRCGMGKNIAKSMS